MSPSQQLTTAENARERIADADKRLKQAKRRLARFSQAVDDATREPRYARLWCFADGQTACDACLPGYATFVTDSILAAAGDDDEDALTHTERDARPGECCGLCGEQIGGDVHQMDGGLY